MHQVAEWLVVAPARRRPLFGRQKPVDREKRDQFESVVARPTASVRGRRVGIARKRLFPADDASNHRLEMRARTATGTSSAPKNDCASSRNRAR